MVLKFIKTTLLLEMKYNTIGNYMVPVRVVENVGENNMFDVLQRGLTFPLLTNSEAKQIISVPRAYLI